jgi:hypothetical protein
MICPQQMLMGITSDLSEQALSSDDLKCFAEASCWVEGAEFCIVSSLGRYATLQALGL